MPANRPIPSLARAERAFAALPASVQDDLLVWILECFRPATTPHRVTSYSLKHQYATARRRQRPAEGDFYVTNDAFQGAMLQVGYVPVDPTAEHWQFRIRPGRAVRRAA